MLFIERTAMGSNKIFHLFLYCSKRQFHEFFFYISQIYLNPVHPELYFPPIFETYPKISSYRLPTHRRGTHRTFFA